MLQTTNYQLNQWDGEDRILRTDFNSDNAKIDAALEELRAAIAEEKAAREAGDLYVKLLDVTTDTAQQQVDFDVSGIDFTQYAEIKLYVSFRSGCNEVLLRVNQQTQYSRQNIDGEGSTSSSYTCNYLAYFDAISSIPWAYVQFNSPQSSSVVRCIFITARGQNYTAYQVVSNEAWKYLKNFSLVTNSNDPPVPVGTRFALYGLKL